MHDSSDDRPHGLVHRDPVRDQLVETLFDCLSGDACPDSRAVVCGRLDRVKMAGDGFRSVLLLGRGCLRHLDVLRGRSTRRRALDTVSRARHASLSLLTPLLFDKDRTAGWTC
jgi:hypothetical protein